MIGGRPYSARRRLSRIRPATLPFAPDTYCTTKVTGIVWEYEPEVAVICTV